MLIYQKTPTKHTVGLNESQGVYKPVKVGLRKMEVTIPEAVLVAQTSRKGKEPFSSPSTVKRRAGCRLFSRSKNSALLALLIKNEKRHQRSDHA